MGKRPGGALSSRPLYFFWVVDCSGSMEGSKIGTVNNAIQEVIPEMRSAADENPNAQLMVQTLRFSDGASWIESTPIEIDNFVWKDLDAEGMTDMGKAFDLLAGRLTIPPMSDRALPPVIVLLSDGYATDDYRDALDDLLKLPWGKKSVRIAISIGEEADEDMLLNFTGNPELVLHAYNAAQLTRAIKWASTAAASVSAPASQRNKEDYTDQSVASGPANAMLNMDTKPSEEDEDGDISAEDVW